MTSPIPSEDALSTSRDSTGPASLAEDAHTMNTDAVGSISTTAVRKRKRRRKKHKGEPRREEQAAAAAAAGGGETELCDLSSDEENGGQWCVGERK